MAKHRIRNIKSKKIIIGSANLGKVSEFTHMIHELGYSDLEIASIDHDANNEINEPYNNFMQNAIHKAKHYAKVTGSIVLSEDSGLCINVLNGFPGVRTKDFILDSGNINNAFLKLEHMLLEQTDYSAHYYAAMVLYCPKTDQLYSHEARDYGLISFPPRGNLGFGFDPIFVPEGSGSTYAELGISIKNQACHRSKVLKKLLDQWMASLT